ncbi:DUF4238 domain-containing protein [Aeoliella sp.]|uniref:DUF4238 domain-containing protein n=1 Tax=Aeoliella sp. TaxID=2795800 RepID=UPI003CCBF13C
MALKENHPKRQHCVPQFLLRHFADAKGKFYVLDKAIESVFESKPGAVIAESWFYDFVDGNGEPHTFEYILSEHESVIANLIASIMNRQSIAHLTKMDRLNIAQFVAVLQYRVQAVRQRLKSLHDGIQRVLEERGFDGGDVAPNLTDQELQHASLAQMHRAINNGRVLAKRWWMLQRAPDLTPFYISDNPVAMVNYLEPRARMIEHPGAEIYLPISRQYTLYIVSDMVAAVLFTSMAPEARDQAEAMRTGRADQLAPENVEHQNSLQVQYASRFVISSRNDFKVAREMIQGNPGLKELPGYTVS